MKAYVKGVGLIVLMLVIALVVAAYSVFAIFNDPIVFDDGWEKEVFVSKGQSFGSIVDSMVQRGVIQNKPLFIFVAKISGGANRVHVGKYRFTSGMSRFEMFERLRDGKGIIPIQVTIQEGLWARSIAKIFSRSIGIDSLKFVSLVRDPSFIQSLGIEAKSLEGYLFPETYNFSWQTDEKEVITRLVNQFQQFYNDSLQQRTKDMGWTLNEMLTFASIVEGEVMLGEEAPTVAGVYHNRLKKGMRLEADPTIQYFVDGGPRRLRYSDLKSFNSYNTYMIKGLPPGPINSPGRAAILGSLFPEKHNYLFFVANGKGGHWFSNTYAEHVQKVRTYRKNRSTN